MIRPSAWRYSLFAVTMAFSAALATGCSSSRVQGEVSLDGTPVDGGTITFFTEVDRVRKNVTGEIKGGKYLIEPTPNLVPGTYRVEIYWHKKTGKQIPSNDPPNMIDETNQVVPKKYNVDSKDTVEMKSGMNTFNFDLKTK